MLSGGTFAYVTSAELRRRLEQSADSLPAPLQVQENPPWAGVPGSEVPFACAVIECSRQTRSIVEAWITSLSILHPGAAILLTGEQPVARKVQEAFGDDAIQVVEGGDVMAAIGLIASRSSVAVADSGAAGRRALGPGPEEKLEIADIILSRIYETAFVIQDGIIVYATKTFYGGLGFGTKDVIGHHFLEFVSQQERAMVARVHQRRIEGVPVIERYEISVRTAGGDTIPSELNLGRVTYRGRPAAVGTILDVRDRHALATIRGKRDREMALMAALTRLAASGKRLVPTMRSALDLIIEAMGADAGGIFIAETGKNAFEPLATRYRGKGPGGSGSWSPFKGPGTAVRPTTEVLRRLRGGRPVLEAPCVELAPLASHHLLAPLRFKKHLRGLAWIVRIEGEPFESGDAELMTSLGGEIAMIQENLRLWDDLQRSYKELLETQKELLRKEKLAAIGHMASHLVHEIRNPVATIMNATGQVRKRVVLGEIETELMDIVEEELARLRRLCDDLVMFSRPPHPHPRHLRLGEFLEFVRSDMIEGRVVPEGVEVTIHASPPDLEVLQDPEVLYALVRHLVLNAIQSMGTRGKVDLRSKVRGSMLCIEVVDTGPGIAPDIITSVFDPFFTTRPGAARLGLAIVKRYVEEMDGELEVESAAGEGTSMILVLPLTAVTLDEDHFAVT